MLGSPLARNGEWTEHDRLLAHALEIDQVYSRCPCGRCGGYADNTLDKDGFHKIREIRCDALAVMEEDEEQREPGAVRFPVYTDD